MPNIFDYLEWRADLSLKADPFNDVDNLILAELAYTEFDGLVPEDGTKVSLESVRDGYFATHSKAEAMGSDNHILRAPVLMDGMLEGERFRGLMLSDYINIIDLRSDPIVACTLSTYLFSFRKSRIRFIASRVFSCVLNAVKRKKYSPLFPNP